MYIGIRIILNSGEYDMTYGQSILKIINGTKDHMTAEQVFFTLKEQFPSVVIATVYNNLNRLYQQGSIRKISVSGQPDRYDRIAKHDHLVCGLCGNLADISLSDMTCDLEKQLGFPIEAYDLKIQYICPECRKS